MALDFTEVSLEDQPRLGYSYLVSRKLRPIISAQGEAAGGRRKWCSKLRRDLSKLLRYCILYVGLLWLIVPHPTPHRRTLPSKFAYTLRGVDFLGSLRHGTAVVGTKNAACNPPPLGSGKCCWSGCFGRASRFGGAVASPSTSGRRLCTPHTDRAGL